jgi:hypothetical protein
MSAKPSAIRQAITMIPAIALLTLQTPETIVSSGDRYRWVIAILRFHDRFAKLMKLSPPTFPSNSCCARPAQGHHADLAMSNSMARSLVLLQ